MKTIKRICLFVSVVLVMSTAGYCQTSNPKINITLDITKGSLGFQPVADWVTWEIKVVIDNQEPEDFLLEGEFLAYIQKKEGDNWGGSCVLQGELAASDKDAFDTKFRLGCGQLLRVGENGRITELIEGSQCFKINESVSMDRTYSWPKITAANKQTTFHITLREPWIPPAFSGIYIATPQFVEKGSKKSAFRYWINLSSPSPCKVVTNPQNTQIVSMDAKSLLTIAGSSKYPMIQRRTALAWLANIAPIPDQQPLLTLVNDGTSPNFVRREAVRALLWSKAPRGEASIIKILSNKNMPSELRTYAVYALGNSSSKESKKALTDAAENDPDTNVRTAAKSSLSN